MSELCHNPYQYNSKGYSSWAGEPGYNGQHLHCELPKNHDEPLHSESHKESDGAGTGHYDSWWETTTWETNPNKCKVCDK